MCSTIDIIFKTVAILKTIFLLILFLKKYVLTQNWVKIVHKGYSWQYVVTGVKIGSGIDPIH